MVTEGPTCAYTLEPPLTVGPQCDVHRSRKNRAGPRLRYTKEEIEAAFQNSTGRFDLTRRHHLHQSPMRQVQIRKMPAVDWVIEVTQIKAFSAAEKRPVCLQLELDGVERVLREVQVGSIPFSKSCRFPISMEDQTMASSTPHLSLSFYYSDSKDDDVAFQTTKMSEGKKVMNVRGHNGEKLFVVTMNIDQISRIETVTEEREPSDALEESVAAPKSTAAYFMMHLFILLAVVLCAHYFRTTKEEKRA